MGFRGLRSHASSERESGTRVAPRFGMQRHLRSISWLCAVLLGLASSAGSASERRWLEVDVTAYNATVAQTDRTPWVAAWGDRLRPGMRAIAVSRDLLSLGLDRGTRVEIDGLPGEYVVLDKTHRRWTRRVDLFMGADVRKALNWGRRKMRIRCIDSCAADPLKRSTAAASGPPSSRRQSANLAPDHPGVRSKLGTPSGSWWKGCLSQVKITI
jgi:3D (Asp-Asp-Asp) domain-containing protein